MAAKFVLTKHAKGKFHFKLFASNAASSPPASSTTRTAAMDGIESIRKNGADAGLDGKTK